MGVTCPLCPKELKNKGLYFHLKNIHPKEMEEIGYPKLKAIAKSKEASKKSPEPEPEPKEKKEVKEIPASEIPASDVPLPDISIDQQATKDMDMATWGAEVGPKVYFRMTPASAFMLRMFGKKKDPSDIVNIALLEYGRRRGVEPAIIKAEGGEQFTLVKGDGVDEDKEFNRLLKLIAANSQMNQSYSQNSPMVMIMEIMKDRVNKGMNMGDFMKDMIKIKFQEMMMHRNPTNPIPLYMMMSRRRR